MPFKTGRGIGKCGVISVKIIAYHYALMVFRVDFLQTSARTYLLTCIDFCIYGTCFYTSDEFKMISAASFHNQHLY